MLVPASRLRWLQARVNRGEFRSVEEAADHFLRQAARLEQEKARIERLALEGLASGPTHVVDDKFWAEFRAEYRSRARSRAARKSA